MADRELANAKLRQDAIRLNATRDINAANYLLQQDLTDVTPERVNAVLAKLRKHVESLAPVDKKVCDGTSDTDIAAEQGKVIEYELKLGDAITELEVRLQELRPDSHNASNPLSTSTVATATTKHRMPELELTKFSGDPLRWNEFWDDFKCSVDDRTNISVIDKFKLLKQCLQGEAASLADGYYLTVANYDHVKDELASRFGDPEVAIGAHLEALLELKPATLETSQLVTVRDKCEAHIRSLIALGLDESSFGRIYAPIILSKLPKLVKMDMNRRNGAKAWTLQALRESLRDEIQIRTKSEHGTHTGSTDKSKPKWGAGHATSFGRKPVSSSTNLLVQGKKGAKPQLSKGYGSSPGTGCVFCSGAHKNWTCRTYPTAVERKERVRDRCTKCLSKLHRRSDCDNQVTCYYCGRDNHNSSLCYREFGYPRDEKPQKQKTQPAIANMVQAVKSLNPDAATFTPAHVTTVHEKVNSGETRSGRRKSGTAILESARVFVIGKRGRQMARIVFDTGSTLSFITSKLVRRVGANPVGYEYRALGRFGDSHREDTRYSTYEFSVELRDGSQLVLEANTVEHVSTPLTLIPLNLEECLGFCGRVELAELMVSQPTEVEIDILIGLDYYYKFMTDKQHRCSNGLILKETTLGYVVTGYLEKPERDLQKGDHQLLTIGAMPRGMEDVERFWRLEEIGITDRSDQTEDEAALKHFNETVHVKDGRYEVQWPFKTEHPDLPNNRSLAHKRLVSVHRKLAKEDGLMRAYDTVLKGQMALGVVEKAPVEPDGIVSFLPHHAVIKPHKTTKLRVVFDASAKPSKDSLSLNDAMYRGPVFLNDLCGLLLRFRLHAVAVVSDVEKAFLQISLKPEHRDCTRFLWVKDTDRPPVADNLEEWRYARVLFGATGSPFLLAACINHHMTATGTPTALNITKNTYVDNVFSFHFSTSEAAAYYLEAKQLFAQISMNLREWYSNDQAFMTDVAPPDRGKSEVTSVLGIQWNTTSDQIKCTVGHVDTTLLTKRSILKSIASVYDPCGWFSPVAIRGRMIMQQLWEGKCGWDDPLPASITMNWSVLAKDFCDIRLHSMPRRIRWPVGDIRSFQLHCFCDASAKAYAAAVYLKIETNRGVMCSLIFAKSRVAPLKKLTINQLELTACLIGTRLIQFVERELGLPVDKKVVWSDSSCVLGWLRKERVATVFVSNRVKEIKAVEGMVHRHVPGEENPADMGTRGLSTEDLVNNAMWWHGPSWLTKCESSWPAVTPNSGEATLTEPTSDPQDNVNLVTAIRPDEVFDISRYSNLQRLYRVSCFVFRAIKRFQRKSMPHGRLQLSELRAVKRFWDMRIQHQHFSDAFQRQQSKSWKDTQHQLGVFIDDQGLLRCRGRFAKAEGLTQSTKCPILLPRLSNYTDLIVDNSHKLVLHFGLKYTVAEVRRAYWIPHARQVVKRVLCSCLTCRRWTGGTFRVPEPPPLPDFRSSMRRPFSCVGIDYAGPLFVRDVPDSGSVTKVWIALFTCAVVRAIHLEVVSSLTASDFLLSFRRFVALYGKPDIVVSDNAKQFKTVDQVLGRAWRDISESDEIQQFAVGQGIQWQFITELAPWMGGFYERLVAPVKSALKKSLGPRVVSTTEMQTIVLEISAVLNNRPLVYSEDEVGELTLTPAHLMFRAAEAFPEIPDFQDYREKVPCAIRCWNTGKRGNEC